MVRSTEHIFDLFAERIMAPPDVLANLPQSERYHSMSFNGDTLSHYGHFPLAHIARDKHQRARLLVLNGDVWDGPGGWGPSTSSRQWQTRGLARGTGIESIIIPFSALSRAGISLDNIEPVHVRPDRHEREYRTSREKPGTRHPLMPDPDGRTTVKREFRFGVVDRDTRTLFSHDRDAGCWIEYPGNMTVPEDAITHDEQPFPPAPPYFGDRDAYNAWVARYAQHTQANVLVRKPLMVPDPNAVYVGRSNWLVATRGDDGVWRWTVEYHWLGDSLFRARLTESVLVVPTDEQVAAWEREQDALRTWHVARDHFRGEYWLTEYGGVSDSRRLRRRDAYAVPRSPEMVNALNNHCHELERAWSNARDAFHALIPDEQWVTQNGNSFTIQRTRARHAYFLSSFDYQESNPLYFLCELRHGVKPRTVEEAIESLKPPEVVAAEARGLKVTRQGDLFAIPTNLSKRQLRKMRGRGRDFTKSMRILGTNHTVTEGVIVKGGAVFGRGVMRHDPGAWRAPDHARQRMGDGKTWHLLVRNTVPRS